MTIINFTPVEATIGGILIGLATTILYYFNGKLLGISGIVGGIVDFKRDQILWRVILFLGLVIGGFLGAHILGKPLDTALFTSYPKTILAGLLVGFGTRFGNGCTSGHGVCGLSRFSKRSLTATSVFMLMGFLTVFFVKKLGL